MGCTPEHSSAAAEEQSVHLYCPKGPLQRITVGFTWLPRFMGLRQTSPDAPSTSFRAEGSKGWPEHKDMSRGTKGAGSTKKCDLKESALRVQPLQ